MMLLMRMTKIRSFTSSCVWRHSRFHRTWSNIQSTIDALIGNPRKMVQLDLLKSHGHLNCSCCSTNATAVSRSWHDTSITCNLAQEYGDVINVHDWYISFEGIVNSTNSKVKPKSYSSPSKKK